MLVKLYKIIFYILIIAYTFSYISIPLKIYDNNNIDKILLLSSELQEQYLSVHLYKEIDIGEPKQKLIFILSPDEYNFYMVLNSSKEIKNDTYNYDIQKSKTNNIYLGGMEVGSSANTFFMKEKFYFDNINITKNNIEEIGINGLDLVLYRERPKVFNEINLPSNVNSYIIFGLRLCESIARIEYVLSLIYQLKKNNITSNFKWFIDYNVNDNEKGSNYKFGSNIQMIIGADPHEVYINKFNESNFRLVNAKSNQGFIFWGLKFDKIYYYENDKKKDNIIFELNNNRYENTTDLEEYLTGEIVHNLFFISSPKEYFDAIKKDLFNKLIEEKKCFSDGDQYKIIYCINNDENKEYLKKNFKTIYFKHHDYNYIFTLKYEDLFIEHNDKLLILIMSEKNKKKWVLGIPFLKKYLLSFDYDFKVIGFYTKQYEEDTNDNNYNFNLIKILVISILFIICGICGFLLSKKLYGMNRKKRVNECEDNYTYEEKNKDKKNSLIINDTEKDINYNKKESLITLEMQNKI